MIGDEWFQTFEQAIERDADTRKRAERLFRTDPIGDFVLRSAHVLAVRTPIEDQPPLLQSFMRWKEKR